MLWRAPNDCIWCLEGKRKVPKEIMSSSLRLEKVKSEMCLLIQFFAENIQINWTQLAASSEVKFCLSSEKMESWSHRLHRGLHSVSKVKIQNIPKTSATDLPSQGSSKASDVIPNGNRTIICEKKNCFLFFFCWANQLFLTFQFLQLFFTLSLSFLLFLPPFFFLFLFFPFFFFPSPFLSSSLSLPLLFRNLWNYPAD